MPKAYKVTRHKIKFDKNNIHDVFSVNPVNYGTLTTSQAADQIANESPGRRAQPLFALRQAEPAEGLCHRIARIRQARHRQAEQSVVKAPHRPEAPLPRALIRGHCEMPGAVP